jgi:hypothetical protein
MESLVYAGLLIGIAAGWQLSPMARLMMWVETLTERVVVALRGAVDGVTVSPVYQAVPSCIAVRSTRPWDGDVRRTIFVRGRPFRKLFSASNSADRLQLTAV